MSSDQASLPKFWPPCREVARDRVKAVRSVDKDEIHRLIDECRGPVYAQAAVRGKRRKQARALQVGREFRPQIAITDMRIAGERVHHIETNVQTGLANS